MKFHPDKNNNSPDSHSRFQRLNAAYEVLGNDEARAIYDRSLTPPSDLVPRRAMSPSTLEHFLSGLWTKTCADGQQQQQHPSGAPPRQTHIDPLVKRITIDLSDAFRGTVLPVHIERRVTHECATESKTETETETETETIYVTIPPGVDDNELIVVANKGHINQLGQSGDVRLFIQICNSTPFARRGLDLHMTKTISLSDALCGFSFCVTHLNGKVYTLNNNRGNIITPGFKKTIPQMGICRDGHTGNLIVEFAVEFPGSITSSQADAVLAALSA